MSHVCYGNRRRIGTKIFAAGNWCFPWTHETIRYSTWKVDLPPGTYMISTSMTMLSAVGGSFDENDTVFADIFYIDGIRQDTTNGKGGVWGHHFGPKGAIENKGISAFVGYVKKWLMFRIAKRGDSWVSASFTITKLD